MDKDAGVLSAAAEARTDNLVLGRYRPVQPLGSGGSGSVWLARDEEYGDAVALKIIPREGKAEARAEREAEAAARLDHERCLRSRGFGADADHVYLAYEYVPGETFRQALRGGRLTDASTVEAGAQILEGLAHAHERGIVHRDVKPSNVLLAEGDDLAVRVLDFGLALFDEADTLTAAGDVPGTLAYISPERLKGRTAGPAADVWAVGVLLWEALAGWHPFWCSSMLDTAKRIQDPAPSLAEARPDLPPALIALVDRSLARDPARRPPAKRMAAALRSAWRSRSREARRRRGGDRRTSISWTPATGRLAAAGIAVLTAGWVAAALPFYPPGWSWAIAAAAGVLTLARERAGLAFTLAVPLLPLGNVAAGLALLYALVAAVWLVLLWREPRRGLLFAAGPLLAPLGLLGFLPLVLMPVQRAARRFLLAGTAVLAAVAVAGVEGNGLPLTGEAAPALPHAHTDSLGESARVVVAALGQRPELLVVAAALALAAAVLPHAARRGYWALAAWGAGLLAVTLVPLADVHALPLVASTWLTCLALGTVRALQEQRVNPRSVLGRARPRLGGGLVPAPARARD